MALPGDDGGVPGRPGGRSSVDEVAHLDLYSCFASSVCFALDALGIRTYPRAARGHGTGGLPYHGGPGSAT